MKLRQILNGRSALALLLLLSAWLWPVATQAQAFDQNTLPQRSPKVPKKPPTPAPSVQSPTPQTNPEDDNELIPRLTGIVIVKSRDEIKEEGVSGVTGIKVVNIPFLSSPDFQKLGYWYLNQSVSIND